MTDEFDRFRAAWGHRALDPLFEHEEEETMKGIMENVRLLDRRQLRRDVREIAIAAGASGVIAATLVWATEPWFRAWILVMSASAALVAVWRYSALFRRQSRSTADSLAAFCRDELAKLDTEIRLQRTLPWWYLAPILVGTNLYVLTTPGGSPGTMAVFTPISAAVVVAIALATRRSLHRGLLPLRAELVHCLDELETDGGA